MQSCKFSDDLGPAKIIHVHEPSLGLKATLVIDNVARGLITSPDLVVVAGESLMLLPAMTRVAEIDTVAN